ncbi:hypothetical protein SDC9_39301 [bioreactor metagenome]|uniref:Carboxypeptidase Q n=1 Tax=bioreactor metagenome TaxID=1076179 RepID=A0A644VPA3_9ZZZZ
MKFQPKNLLLKSLIVLALAPALSFAQNEASTIDAIRQKALEESKVMSYITELSQNVGARLTFTNRYQLAVDWAMKTLAGTGLQNVHTEYWEPSGRDWNLKKYTFTVVKPYPMFINSCPKGWSAGTQGLQSGDLVYLDARKPEDFEKYKGKLKGKIVLVSFASPFYMSFDPVATRYADSSLDQMAVIKAKTAEELDKEKTEEDELTKKYKPYFQLMTDRIDFCNKEGAIAVVESGYRPYGSVMSFSISHPGEVNDQFDFLTTGYRTGFPDGIPQITIAMEQYNTLVQMLKNNTSITAELNIEAELGTKPVKGMSVLGEIKGSKKPNEIVTIGAHLDSYQAGQGAADNGAGVAIMIEAMRILNSLGIQPERTIRIGLWGGEEQGYLGSTDYVKTHFTEGTEKHYVYFNLDNGAGLIRGIQLQNNSKAVDLMKEWFGKASLEGSNTVSVASAEYTDHVPFAEAGLPGFQFIQDHLDYYSTYHTQVDLMDRIPEDDMKKNAYLIAVLTWLAANHQGNFPQ